jgi:hypothetical protein
MDRVFVSLQAHENRHLGNYRRLVSLQAWRSELLEPTITDDALGFFLEAQNDGLVSLVLTQLGSCRAALQSLRSCMENVLFTLYYMDHPVEFALWNLGRHRLAFNQLEAYFTGHPSLDGIPQDIHGLRALSDEYSVLSRAVHGTAVSFRMSASDTGTQLWCDDVPRLGMYETRQKRTISTLNQLLLCVFREQLQGAVRVNLRKAISLAIPASRHSAIKASTGVSLFAK